MVTKRVASVLLLGLFLMGLLVLSGCDKTVEHGREDVEKYLEEIGIQDYTLAEERYEVEDPDGGTDYYWDVTTNHFGFDEPITFHVIDHFYQSYMSPLRNVLMDDTDSAIQERIREVYEPTGDLTYYDAGSEGGGGSFLSYPIYGRDSFIKSYFEIVKFQSFLQDYPNLADRTFTLVYELNDSGEAAVAVDTVTPLLSISLWITPQEPSKDAFRIWLEGEEGKNRGNLSKYLKSCLENGLIDRIDEFSQGEIDKCIDWHRDGGDPELTRVMDESFDVINEKVVYAWHNGHIAFGNVYRLAKDAGLEVTGDYWDFTIVGADGNTYSYACDDFESPYWTPELPVSEVSKILGIEVDDGAKRYEWVIGKNLQDMLGMTEEDMIKYVADNSDLAPEDIKVEEGNITFTAKQYELEGIIEANEKKMEELEQALKKADPEFRYQQHNVYSNLSITTSEGGEILESEEKRVTELMAYAWFNLILVENSSKLSVSYYYAEEGNYGTSGVFIEQFYFPEE